MMVKGFYETSVNDIANRADVSVGLLYRYFKNKESIIEALVLKVVQRLKNLLNEDYDNVINGKKRLAVFTKNGLTPQAEKSIFLMLEISSEATRNPRIKKIVDDAYQDLKKNALSKEQEVQRHLNEDVINARFFVISLIIDGLIVRRCMKKKNVSKFQAEFFHNIINDIDAI